MSKIKGILLITLIPIIVVVFLSGSFFSIIDGLTAIIEGYLAKLSVAIKNFTENPNVYLADAWTTVWEELDKWWSGGNDEFNPDTLAIQRLTKPSITIGLDDFNNIRTNIDVAKVNREIAGLEDYMLKIMLLSYYRSVYLSDYNIYMELTDEEANGIEKLNNNADKDEGKYPCPFELVKRFR